MATMHLFDRFRERFYDGTGGVDLEYSGTPANAALRVMLFQAFTPNQNTNTTVADLGTEVSGTNYTSGGNALANAAVTMDGSGNIDIDAADPATWSQHASGFSNCRRVVVVMENAGAVSTYEVVAYSDDLGSDKGNVSGDFTVQLHANGLFTSAR